MYLRPNFVPGDRKGDTKSAKMFRLRNKTQSLACILAQYGYAHALDQTTLERGGLYGNLIVDGDIIRWMSLPELCNAMGLLVPWTAPLDPREAYPMVENAIATPHAMLRLVNTIAQTSKVEWDTTPTHLIDLAMSHRLSASRQEVLVNSATGKIQIKELAVSPTLPWSDPPPDFAVWYIPVGPGFCQIRIHPGLPVARVLRFVFPNAHGGSITWRPRAFPDVQIPLTLEDVSGYDTVHFDGIFGNMQIREGECHVIARPFTVVCSPSGLFIVAKQVRCPTQSLLMSLSGHIPQMLGPTDMWGFPLPLTEDCPDLAFMLPAIHDTPPQPIIDALTWKDTDSGWDVHTTEEQLHTYIRFCREVGLLALVESLGWQMVVVPPGVDYRPAWCVTFRPAVHSPSVSKPQFRSICTATIAQALFPPETSDSKAVKVALKPWDTWHPVRSWPRDTLVEALLKPWQQASRHTGAQFLLRALHGGRQMTNEHQLGTYIPVTHSKDEVTKFHFVMQQHGGGSKLDAHHRLKQQAVEFLLQWGVTRLM